MKVRVNFQTPDVKIDRIFEGRDAQAVVAAMQKALAAEMNFAMRLLIAAMSPLQFAQETVNRYNAAMKRSAPRPSSCEEFIRLAQAEGIATVLEP